MNIFSIYLEKIKEFLIDLEKHEQIKLPDNLNNLTIELTPKDLQGDISCNAALILSKTNNKKPKDIAEFLKTNLIIKFSEFKNIFIAEPGFLNIEFKDDFWHKFLSDLLNLKEKYGSNFYKKNRYNIEFVSANPTGPLHVGHCRGSILGDVIANLLIFNGNAVTKEYYVNDLGKQIKNFTLSVYYRIIEILHNKEFPNNRDDLYPGDNVVDIAKKIIDKKLISEFNNFDNIYEQLREISVKESLELIKINLNSLGIHHDHFVFESQLYKNNEIQATVEKLKKKDLLYYGKIAAPKFKEEKKWKEDKPEYVLEQAVKGMLPKNKLGKQMFKKLKGYEANIILCEPTLEDRETTLNEITKKTGAQVIHPFNNSNVIAGQGTAALEMIEDLGTLDGIIAPIGGGGLMSGTCITTRSLLPEAKLFGAEPAGADDAYHSLKEGKIIPQTNPDTICDGLLTCLGEYTWNILKDHLEAIYTVTDDEVINAMRLVWERMKIIIEPSSATAVAVALKSEFKALEGLEKVGIILTGGNVELSKLPF